MTIFRRVLYSLFLATAAMANGGMSGGGGDEVGVQFKAAFDLAYGRIQQTMPELYSQLSNSNLRETADQANVTVTDDLLPVSTNYGIQNSIAINFPETMQIKINRARWNHLGLNIVKQAIALHEVLSLKRMESTGNYPFTSAFLRNSNVGEQVLDTLQWSEDNRDAGSIPFAAEINFSEDVTLPANQEIQRLPFFHQDEAAGVGCAVVYSRSTADQKIHKGKWYVILSKADDGSQDANMHVYLIDRVPRSTDLAAYSKFAIVCDRATISGHYTQPITISEFRLALGTIGGTLSLAGGSTQVAIVPAGEIFSQRVSCMMTSYTYTRLNPADENSGYIESPHTNSYAQKELRLVSTGFGTFTLTVDNQTVEFGDSSLWLWYRIAPPEVSYSGGEHANYFRRQGNDLIYREHIILYGALQNGVRNDSSVTQLTCIVPNIIH